MGFAYVCVACVCGDIRAPFTKTCRYPFFSFSLFSFVFFRCCTVFAPWRPRDGSSITFSDWILRGHRGSYRGATAHHQPKRPLDFLCCILWGFVTRFGRARKEHVQRGQGKASGFYVCRRPWAGKKEYVSRVQRK